MNNMNMNLNANNNNNPNNIQFTPQQLQMLRAAGMNSNSNVNNVLAQSQGQTQLNNNNNQQQAAQLYNMMFLQQQQQQLQQQLQQQQQQQLQQQQKNSSGANFNTNTSPNIFPMTMNPMPISMQQSPNMMKGIMQQMNPSNQNAASIPNSNNQTASPQVMAQMMAAAGFNSHQFQYLAQQQQLLPQQILLNPQQLAMQQQNQLLYSSSSGPNASSNSNSPSLHPVNQPNQQQINQLLAARQLQQQFAMQQQGKINYSPQSVNASPSISAQQLFVAQQNKQMQRPILGQGGNNMTNMNSMNNMIKNSPVPMNPNMVNLANIPLQQQRAIPQNSGTPAMNTMRPKMTPQQPGNMIRLPNMQPTSQQHQQQESLSRAPLFPICPQQSCKLFSLAPMHGLLDLHASIHGGYQGNPQGGSNSIVLGGVHVDGNSASGASGLLVSGGAASARNIVKGLTDMNGRRARLEETAGGASTIESGQKRKLNKVIEELDVECELDADSERCLLRFTDDFLNQVILHAAKIAKHAGSSTIQVKDVQLELEHNWNIRIPGFEGGITETSTAPKKSLAAAQSAALSLSQSTPHNSRLLALAKVKKESLLRKGIAFMEMEKEATELASAFELSNGDKEEDVDDEVVDVVEFEGVDDEAVGAIGEEGSDDVNDLIDTPTNLTAIDSPFIEIIE